MKDSIISTNQELFFNLLRRSINAKELFQSLYDADSFAAQVIPFCNSSHDYAFSEEDFEIMCDFLMSGIRKSLTHVVSEIKTAPEIYSFIDKACDFSRYMALYWKNRITRSYFDSALTYLLIFPTESSASGEAVTGLFRFYNETSLLETLCFCTDVLMNYSISDSLLSPFMRMARHSEYGNIFSFYLYRFNPHYFRHHNKIYPDECSISELYHGLQSGFFRSLGCEEEALEILSGTCELLPHTGLSAKSLGNPLYAIWKLYSDSVIPSLKDYSAYFEHLFSN